MENIVCHKKGPGGQGGRRAEAEQNESERWSHVVIVISKPGFLPKMEACSKVRKVMHRSYRLRVQAQAAGAGLSVSK